MSSFFACAGHGRSRVGTARRGSPAPKRRQSLQRTAPRRAAGRRSGRGSPSATRGERRQRKAPARGARSGQVLQRAMQQPRLFFPRFLTDYRAIKFESTRQPRLCGRATILAQVCARRQGRSADHRNRRTKSPGPSVRDTAREPDGPSSLASVARTASARA